MILNEVSVIFIFGLGFLVAAACIIVLMPWADVLGVQDQPGGRRGHMQVTPLLGGLAIFVAFISTAWPVGLNQPKFGGYLLGAFILVVTGIMDDRRQLPLLAKLCGQVIACLILIYFGGLAITDLGNVVGTTHVILGEWSVPFTLFCMLAIINAMNMLDGIDGAAGTVSLTILAVLTALAAMDGQFVLVAVLIALCGAVSGFLAFNIRLPWRDHAAVFMGDTGSMLLGYTLGWLVISFSQGDNATYHPVLALWLLAIPLLDGAALIVKRVFRGQSPLTADRDHFHHILIRAGFSVSQTVLLLMVLTLISSLSGLLLMTWGVPDFVLLAGFLLLFMVYFYLIDRTPQLITHLLHSNRL